ncbi:unnamed protein product [Alopecurus aequalis]
MENEPSATKRTRTSRPHEIITEILLRLPIRSLLRFSCICQAWRAPISHDPAFRRDLHLRRRGNPCLLIAPLIKQDDHNSPTVGLYKVTRFFQPVATLMHAVVDSSPLETAHGFAHCDGLVLLWTESALRVLNPATRRVLTLPGSPGISHHAFGLGRDPRTGAYKVVRFVRRTTGPTTSAHLMWRCTPSEPTRIGLNLENETFGVVAWPPCGLWFHNEVSMSELRGELCMTCPGQNNGMIDMWMCGNIDGPDPTRWEKRYTIQWYWHRVSLRPVAMLADGVLVCQTSMSKLYRFILHSKKCAKIKGAFFLRDLEYLNQDKGTLLVFPHKSKSSFEVIPYVPSLAPI